jgi:DNA-binding MurR/RpiR family transcriptional regulator
MRSNLHSLNNKERKLAEYILANPLALSGLSIHTLAANLGISQGTIIHFCQNQGFSGYKEFKEVLATLPQEFIDEPLQPDFGPLMIAKSVWDNISKVLDDTLTVLDHDAFNLAVEVLAKSERIDFYARGGSARIAENAARKFVRWGHHVTFYRDSPQQKLSASQLPKGSVAIGITYSGKTPEVLDCLAVAKKRGAFCIVITSCQRSPAAELGDVVLLSAIRGPEMFNENEFSKIAQIAILDALYFNFIKNDL